MGYQIKNKKGFTLMEIMVSMSIFFVVFAIALNTFFYANKLQKKMLVFYNVESNFQASLYKMISNMENSLIDFTWYTDTLKLTNHFQEIRLKSNEEKQLVYSFNSETKVLSFNPDAQNVASGYIPINNSDTEIESVNFYINVLSTGETNPNKIAFITFTISGKFKDGVNKKDDFSYQFSVKQIIDPYYMGTKSSYCDETKMSGILTNEICAITNGSGYQQWLWTCNLVTHEKEPKPTPEMCIVNSCNDNFYIDLPNNKCTACECNGTAFALDGRELWVSSRGDEDQLWCESSCRLYSCDNIPINSSHVFVLRDINADNKYELLEHDSGNVLALSDAMEDPLRQDGDKIYIGSGTYQFVNGDFKTAQKAIDLVVCQDATIQPEVISP